MAVETLERRPTRLYWWKEAGLVIAFYLIYSFTRNRFGSHRVEIGYVFNRDMKIASISGNDIGMDSTLIARVGLAY